MEAAIRSETDIEPYDDEYYYGYRTIIETDEKGGTVFSYRPLTSDDFLDPEEGDVYMQGTAHVNDVIRLRSIFRYHLRDRKNIAVYSDLKIEWGISGLSNPAPDISIIADVNDPEKPRSIFYVPEEGVKPFFILEVVSPRYRNADADKKPEIYRKAGVSEYIIADPGLKDNEISYTVRGYRLIGNRYVNIASDRHGRIYSQTTGVWIGASESRDRLVIYDDVTGEEILSDEERAEAEVRSRMIAEAIAEAETQSRISAEAIADREKQRADQEKQRADQERLRAERLAAKLRELGIMPEEI